MTYDGEFKDGKYHGKGAARPVVYSFPRMHFRVGNFVMM